MLAAVLFPLIKRLIKSLSWTPFSDWKLKFVKRFFTSSILLGHFSIERKPMILWRRNIMDTLNSMGVRTTPLIFVLLSSMAAVERRLQQALRLVSYLVQKRGLSFSVLKTKIVHFYSLRSHHCDPKLYLDGRCWSMVEDYRFLEVVFDLSYLGGVISWPEEFFISAPWKLSDPWRTVPWVCW